MTIVRQNKYEQISIDRNKDGNEQTERNWNRD